MEILKELKNNFSELKVEIKKDDIELIENRKFIKALKSYNSRLYEMNRILKCEKAGMFKAFDYKSLQEYAEFLEEDRNLLRKECKKLEEDNILMQKFINIMGIGEKINACIKYNF